MTRKILRRAWVVLAMVWVAGAYNTPRLAEPATPAVVSPAEWVKSEIFFGCDLPGGQQVSRWAWADFMDRVLTRRFPKGLTISEAYGQMQHGDGRIEKQSTWVVVILHPKEPSVDQAIQEIIDSYRKQFGKAQVVYVSTPVISARFYAD